MTKELAKKVENLIMRMVRLKTLFGSGLRLPMLALFIATPMSRAQTWTQTSAPTSDWWCLAASADGNRLVAERWPGGIYTSTNSGATWAPTIAVTNSWCSVASSADGSKLLAAADYIPGDSVGGLFTSTNFGATWVSNSLPAMYWYSVASSADGNTWVAVAPWNNSNFGTPGAIFCSTNGGINWTSNTLNNPAGVAAAYAPVGVTASADGKKIVVAAPFVLYRSTDSGTTWTLETNAPTLYGISSPSQYIASSADGTKLALCVPSDVDNNPGPIYVSTNSGDTWNVTSAPNQDWENITMSANGDTIVAVPLCASANVICLSTNCGHTWTTNSPVLFWSDVAVSADGGKLAATTAGGPIYVSQSIVSPQMAIAPANSGMQLSWLVPSTSFVLQQSADLSTWADTTNCPVLNLENLQDEVTLPSTNGAGFYRLKVP